MIILAWIIAILSGLLIIVGIGGKLMFFEMSEAEKIVGKVVELTKDGSIVEFEVDGEKKREKHPGIIPINSSVKGVYEANNDVVIIDSGNHYVDMAITFLISGGVFGLIYSILVFTKILTSWASLLFLVVGIGLLVTGFFYSSLVKEILANNKVINATCVEHKEKVLDDITVYSGVYTYVENNKEKRLDNLSYIKDKNNLLSVGETAKMIYFENNYKLSKYKNIEKFMYLRYILIILSGICFAAAFLI